MKLAAEKKAGEESEMKLAQALKARQRRGLAVRVGRDNDATEAKLAEAYRHLAAGTKPDGHGLETFATDARLIADRLRLVAELRSSQVVRPGTSIGRGDEVLGSCGSICCVVRDAGGKRYLITVSEAVAGPQTNGRGLIQPAFLDAQPHYAGAELKYKYPPRTVATTFEADDKLGYAWAELDKGIAASNDVPSIGPIRGVATADMFRPGAEVLVVGCGSGHRTGKLLNERPPAESPPGTLVATRMSVPTDGGGPVLVKASDGYYLVGFMYRIQVALSRPADDDRSLIVPLGELFKSKGFELWRE
jgi:hypothetical protein